MTHDVSLDVPCGDQGGCCDPENSKQEAGRPDHAKAMHWSQEPQPSCEDKSPLQCPVLDLHCMQIDSYRESNDSSWWDICCSCLHLYWAGTSVRAGFALHAGRFLQGQQ